MQQPLKTETELSRSLSLWQLVFFGIGSILGAGIYVLLGEVANISGMATPSAFLLAGFVVSLCAYSFSQLSRQFPVSAGPAVYIQEAFHSQLASRAIGITIVLAGIVSSATLLNGFTGYISIFVELPDNLMIIILCLLLFAITAYGVTLSVSFAVVTTIIEIIGLIMVVSVTGEHWHDVPWRQFLPKPEPQAIQAVTTGAFLAFYAFIGFEDMVTLSEEVKDPRRNVPAGILIALIATLILYEVTAIAAVISVPLEQLAVSSMPLTMIVERNSQIPAEVISLISLVAIVNGALIQMIMASRVLYGMARKGLIPRRFSKVSPATHTPLLATLTTAVLILVFALALPLVKLAELTSTFILFVFLLVNLALATLGYRERCRSIVKRVIPVAGALVCSAFLLLNLFM